jgi:hypothetical protein
MPFSEDRRSHRVLSRSDPLRSVLAFALIVVTVAFWGTAALAVLRVFR